MCGIFCLVSRRNKVDPQILANAVTILKHRGPDAEGIAILENQKIGIAHTRLSLVDLSSEANQPMCIDGYTISFNGEIYNHKILRRELESQGVSFLTASDTEVIIRAVHCWGIDTALDKFNGCFAFVLYDAKKKNIYIVRDHLGEKQLSYTRAVNGDLIFASEAKALFVHPDVKKEPDIDKFREDLIFSIFADPQKTYFKNIQNFPAGHYMVVDMSNLHGKYKIKKYWDIDSAKVRPYTKKDIPEIIVLYKNYLTEAVKRQLDADCEVGSILSGGIDSSLITSLGSDLQFQDRGIPLQCFTLRYDFGSNKDFKNARLLSQWKKHIKHHDIIPSIISPDLVDHITYISEAPLLDKIAISQYFIYTAVQNKRLKAVINGQGSDEFWLGYYLVDPLFHLPSSSYTTQGLCQYWRDSSVIYDVIPSPETKVLFDRVIEENIKRNFTLGIEKNSLQAILKYSIRTHLAGVFKEEDVIAMAQSIEVRLPYIDRNIINLALALPPNLKIYDHREKYIPRIAAKNFLPPQIRKRKKLGFPPPPREYDEASEKAFDKKEIYNSRIIQEIFQTSQIKNLYRALSLRFRWQLCALRRMEKVYF